MAHFLIDKRTMELFPYVVDFTELLDDLDTKLDDVKTTAKVLDSSGADKTSVILKKLIFNGTKIVTLVLSDGIDGEDYTIFVTGVGDVKFAENNPVRVIELRVRDSIVSNL